ncbi:interactor of constitutive active ROPs 2, chloroplastic-like [Gossypium hirsutum]|uniref:Interactor of constitutive active ROPs 2, chloroplastic-like n=1 Tax=Gossypium hirsutum TaxID=3635 RepID=A0ABM3AM23_GOSHI|nr:interactor of constitutive active ROPs 2, chloroplastic-like [Gossypium hirsutum]
MKHAKSAHAEIQNMKIELTETLSLVKKLKSELTDCRESEAWGLELVSKTRMQLEVANKTIENLRSNATKETEAYNMLLLELEQSKCRVKSLEGLVSKLQVELVVNGCIKDPEQQNEKNEEIKRVKTELNFAKLEISQLRLALDEAEVRYQKEYIKSTLQIRSAYEQVECIKTELSQKKAKLKAELTRTKANVEELRQKNKGLRESELAAGLKKLEFDLKELKDNLTVKETELNTITEQNKMLKREIESKMKSDESVVVSLEASKASEQAALMRVGYLTEETDKFN